MSHSRTRLSPSFYWLRQEIFAAPAAEIDTPPSRREMLRGVAAARTMLIAVVLLRDGYARCRLSPRQPFLREAHTDFWATPRDFCAVAHKNSLTKPLLLLATPRNLRRPAAEIDTPPSRREMLRGVAAARTMLIAVVLLRDGYARCRLSPRQPFLREAHLYFWATPQDFCAVAHKNSLTKPLLLLAAPRNLRRPRGRNQYAALAARNAARCSGCAL